MTGYGKDLTYVWLTEERKPAILLSRRAWYSIVTTFTEGEAETKSVDNDDIEFYDEDGDLNEYERE